MNSEVLIIGGGVIGLSIARELHKSGVRDITLIEKGRCGEESSWAAGGMLGPQAEADEGGIFMDVCSASRDLYPELAAELFEETGVDIELERTGTLSLGFTDNDVRELKVRYDWQKEAGLTVERLSANETRRAEPFVSPDVRESLFFPADWQVDNRKLLAALLRYADLNDIRIIENSSVERLIVDGSRVTGAETNDDTVNAATTILATGAWTSLIKLGLADIPFAVKPVRGQMIVFQTAKRVFNHVIYSRRGYLVPRLDGRILAGSTSEDVGFEKAVTESAARGLKEMASEISPNLTAMNITDHWSGLRPFAADGMPVIGNIDGIDNMFIATAHYRNGILLAPWTAKLTAGAVVENERSAYLKIFGPGRFRFRGAGKGF